MLHLTFRLSLKFLFPSITPSPKIKRENEPVQNLCDQDRFWGAARVGMLYRPVPGIQCFITLGHLQWHVQLLRFFVEFVPTP